MQEGAVAALLNSLTDIPTAGVLCALSRGWVWTELSCEPMLGLLDHHGVPRAEAYRSVQEGAVATLLDSLRSDAVPLNKLLQVTQKTIPSPSTRSE